MNPFFVLKQQAIRLGAFYLFIGAQEVRTPADRGNEFEFIPVCSDFVIV